MQLVAAKSPHIHLWDVTEKTVVRESVGTVYPATLPESVPPGRNSDMLQT